MKISAECVPSILINSKFHLTYINDIFRKPSVNMKYGLFFFFLFLEPQEQHMEVPGLGVKSDLQLPAYATATATPDLSCICDLH